MKTENGYRQWLIDLKKKIRQSQIKAAVKINTELLRLYWDLGRDIVSRQMETAWGSGFFEQLSKDLRNEILKDPINFDFITLTKKYKEKELENALIANLTKFLLELGRGFAYVGRQVPVKIGKKNGLLTCFFIIPNFTNRLCQASKKLKNS